MKTLYPRSTRYENSPSSVRYENTPGSVRFEINPTIDRYDNTLSYVRYLNRPKILNWRIPFLSATLTAGAILTESGIEITTESGDTLIVE